MVIKPGRFLPIIMTATLIAMGIGGCSTVDKFRPGQSAYLTPFAEQTITMVGTINYNISSDQAVYLRDISSYMGGQHVFNRYIALEEQVTQMMKIVVVYSLQIVAISEQDISDENKANALADTLVVLDEHMMRDPSVSPPRDKDEFNRIIQSIRESETYLEALQNSTRLINAFSQYAGEVLDEIRTEQNILANRMDKAIDRKFSDPIKFADKLRSIRADYYNALTLLADYDRNPKPVYFDKLHEVPIYTLQQAINNKQSLSSEDINTLQIQLTERMKVLNENYTLLLPDIESYYKSLTELYEILQAKDLAIKSARLFFVAWSRAYGRMAAGKTDPAEWFDVTDTGGLLFGAAKSAAGL